MPTSGRSELVMVRDSRQGEMLSGFRNEGGRLDEKQSDHLDEKPNGHLDERLSGYHHV
jgi:hypothetical protein